MLVVRLIEYDEFTFTDIIIKKFDTILQDNKSKVVWIDVLGLFRTDIIEEIGAKLGIHPLILEDVVNTSYQPKITFYENMIFLVLKFLSYDESVKEIKSEHISFVLSKNFLVTFQEIEDDTFHYVYERIVRENSRIRKRTVDYLFYALINLVIENYAKVLYQIGSEIEELESKVLTTNDKENLKHILKLKNDIVFLRKTLRPLREILFQLGDVESDFFQEANKIYLRDLRDHGNQVLILLDELNESVTVIYEVYMSVINNKMNEVMKILTIVATIFIPLTFIVGLYGMNFKYMPELELHWAYPAVLIIMASIGLSMVLYFKRKNWF
ncbi:MAG: magnesium/cobalt transporter CorA [Candidatus Kapabacteria bacterium]|nr:magnesium/cobalt transporter CorA [Candidatus Kapabacteria bacterium]